MNKEKNLGFQIRCLHNLIRETVDKTRPAGLGNRLTQLQAGIMGYLFHNREHPVYQKDIEEEFQVSRATATNTLKTMEKNHLITRKAMDKDGRLKRITMTERALKNHSKVEVHIQEMNDKMIAGLSPHEVEQFLKTIDILRSNLEIYGKEKDKSHAENISQTDKGI